MSLCSLPTELKLQMMDFLEPQSLLPFALSSKEHLKLCDEHLKMFAIYHTIKPAKHGEGFDIWKLTKEVIQDPRKAWYVRDLNLVTDRPAFHDDLSEEDAALFRTAAERILPLYPYEPGFFAAEHADLSRLEQMSAVSGVWQYESAVLVILLHHLSQLRTFRMTDELDHDFLLAFMRRVAEGYQNPALAPQMPLQHLQTAGIAHWDTESSCSMDWAVYFMCVPSLRTFTALMMGSEGVEAEFFTGEEGSVDDPGNERHLRNTAAAPVSNVEHLAFTECQFDSQSFNTLLPMTKNLKTFSYRAAGPHVAYTDHNPRKAIKALVNHCAHSLEQLDLSDSGGSAMETGENDLDWAPAHLLKKLKALHCEARWLESATGDVIFDGEALREGFYATQDPADKITDPRNNLPASLEFLFLDGCFDTDEWREMRQMFAEGNEHTPKLTPDTTWITRDIDGQPMEGTDFNQAMDKIFVHSLSYKFWKGHNSWWW